MKRLFLIIGLSVTLTGCSSARVKPGHGATVAPGVSAQVTQSEDPQAVTVQTVESDTETIYAPAPLLGAVQDAPAAQVGTGGTPQGAARKVTHFKTVTSIGAAQKNTLGETIAKLASLRWLQYLGAAVALFGLASLFYPPLKLIVASVTTSAACLGSGLVMIFLPVVVVGNELLIAGVCLGGFALWFFAHRHGELRGTVNALQEKK